jgi:hypothetical protein
LELRPVKEGGEAVYVNNKKEKKDAGIGIF